MLKRLIIETRYNPASTFLDTRGAIIEKVKKYFQGWAATGISHLEFEDKERKLKGFITAHNAGAEMIDPDISVFRDTSKSFLKNAFEEIKIDAKDFTRIGVRSTFAIPYEGSFNNLLNIFKEKFLKIDDTHMPNGFEVIDVGFPLTLNIGDKKCNLDIGPMEIKQFEQILPGLNNLPPVGIFLDVDYFESNLQNKYGNFGVILNHLDIAISGTNELVDKFREILELA